MREARSQLKRYNNAFAFVSYGEKCFHKIDGTRGPPVTVCHGTVYHLSGILFPDDGELGKYAQVYLYDHNEAMDLRQRNHWNDGLDKHILEQLQIMMDRESPYVAMYRSMKEKMSELPPETKMVIAETEGHDMRRYNKPRQLEPAVVFRSQDGTPPPDRDIAVWPRDPQTKVYRISDKCEHVDPLAYPLLFPRGELGWRPKLKHQGRTAEKTAD